MKLIPDSMIEKRWHQALENLEVGSLRFTAPNGETHLFAGAQAGPEASFQIADWGVLADAIARGDIGLGEDYIDARWETDDVEALISLFLLNMDRFDGFAHGDLINRLGFVLTNTLLRRNSVAGSARNIKAHYDVGNEFYALWLDKTMTYSSALYEGRDCALESAQERKYGRILDKIENRQARVLEIGCGWGGFAEQAVEAGHELTGVTISPSQHAFAKKRLNGAADIRLQDYRAISGVFDAIVSIEMLEAVGERYWKTYFAALASRLKKGGRAVLQTITVGDDLFPSYRARSDFIRHYVFPGGMLPSVKRIREEAKRAGLAVIEEFSFGQDYAKTLRAWSARFQARAADIAALGHDAAFLRNWNFYLGMCAASFAVARTDVVQLELRHA